MLSPPQALPTARFPAGTALEIRAGSAFLLGGLAVPCAPLGAAHAPLASGALMDVWSQLLALPTGIYTGLLGMTVLYWLLVILGGLDMDVLGGATEGAAEGALDGAVDAALDGAVDAALDGAADAALDGAADAALDGAADGALDGATDGLGDQATSWLSALRPTNVPVTFSLSILVLTSWFMSYLGMKWLAPPMDLVLPHGLTATLIGVGALVPGVFLTGLFVKPFTFLFRTHNAPHKVTLTGKVCVLTTGTADATFGQASVEDGGSGHVIQVRYEGPTPPTRGQRALITSYDPERDVFEIEPLEDDDAEDRVRDVRDGPVRTP